MTIATPPFNDLVAHAIASHGGVSPEQLIVCDNSSKYQPNGFQSNTNPEANLAAIFKTMANLNQTALEDPAICAGSHGPSFRGALLEATDEIASLAAGRSIRYIELGPEPWKSRVILTQLLAVGAQLQQYVGVDINPESEQTMRDTLVPVIGADRFTYWVEDFYQCSIQDCPKVSHTGVAGSDEDTLTVVTNLGFQEGNDLPTRIGPMLTRITQPGDLLLSEMQVSCGDAGAEAIRQFYHHPEMHRFSSLVGQCFDSGVRMSGKHVFHLVPLQTDVGRVPVAATLVPVHIHGQKKYVLTNSCLKYTVEQFHQARELSGNFVVKWWGETGDQSVVFQLSERR